MTEAPLPKAPKPFALWQIGLVFAAAVAAEVVIGGAMALAGYALVDGRDAALAFLFSPAAMAVQIILGSATLASIALVAPRLRGFGAREALALAKPSAQMLALGALGVVPVGLLSDELTYAIGSLAPSLFDTGVLDQFARVFESASASGFALITVAVVVFPAIGEELLFRGFVMRSLARRIPAPAAAVATAALFGAIHFDALQGLGAMIVGLYLAFVALVSGSLWPAVAAHALNNLLCSLFARFDPEGAGTAFDQGHPWYVLLASAAALAVVIAAMWRAKRVANDGVS